MHGGDGGSVFSRRRLINGGRGSKNHKWGPQKGPGFEGGITARRKNQGDAEGKKCSAKKKWKKR